MPMPGFNLPEPLLDRLFNLHTGTRHDFLCATCGKVTSHFSTTHSALEDNVLLKIVNRVLLDLTGLGNVIEGKPYVCTECGRVWFE
jgi:hypothetical protein